MLAASAAWLGLAAYAFAAFAGPSAPPADGATPPTVSATSQAHLEAWIATLNRRFQTASDEEARRTAARKRIGAERISRWNSCVGSRILSCGPMPEVGP